MGVSEYVAAAVTLAVACCGCQRHGSDSTDASQPHQDTTDLRTALPGGVTADQRAEWRTRLRWSDDCEDAFRASAAGTGGIDVVKLGPAVSLVEVTCAAGAYQPSVVRFRLTEDDTGVHHVPLSFPVYASDDGRTLRRTLEMEVWGESVVTPGTAEIAILSLARQTADCGVWARYSLAGDRPRLLAAAAQVRCPATPGAPVAISVTDPPAGWNTIPGED